MPSHADATAAATAALLLVYFAFRVHSVSIALCVWQSFSPPSQSYSRSDRAYQNLSAVIDAYGGGGWLSPSLPTDKATVHSYVRVYDTLLAPLRSSVAAVWECGESARVWGVLTPAGWPWRHVVPW